MPHRKSYPKTSYITFLLAALLLLAPITRAATERDFRGIPYYNFFTSRDFDSGASSVFITTATDGTIFYGDQNWVSQYDGAAWHKVYQNSNTDDKITFMLWDQDGQIYAAGFNLFGIFSVDENNVPSIRPLVPQESFQNNEAVKKIESTPHSVYLTGRRSFACYDKDSGNMDLHILSTWITASFLKDGEYYLLTDNNDMFRYRDGKLSKLSEISSLLSQSEITVADIEIGSDGSIIMASERRGIYRLYGNTFSQSYPNFIYNPEYLITDIELISQDRLLVASLGGGITVLDSEGNTIENFGPKTDYRFQSSRAVNVDKSGAVWAIFNNTVAKILLDSPLSAIDERIRPSFFYASQHFYENELYVRSFYILYKAVFDKNGRISSFENALPDSDFEVWSVAETNDGLYLNTANHGIFLLAGDSPSFVIEAEAFDRFEHSKVTPNYLVGANSNSISLFEKKGTALSLLQKIENPGGFINRLEEDGRGQFWIEYGLGRTARIRIQNGQMQLDQYGPEYGIPPNQWVSLWMHKGIPHLNTNYETLLLDPSQGTFKIDESLQQAIGSENVGIGRAFTDPDENLWLSTNNKNLIFWKQPDGSYLRDETSLSEMGEPYFESIEFLKNGDALLMTSFELFHFRKSDLQLKERIVDSTTKIIRIEDPKDEDKLFASLGNDQKLPKLELDFAHNNLEFTVSNVFTYSTMPPQFQFRLEGFSDASIPADELHWSNSSKVSYTNLQPGSYSFKARTKLGNGTLGPWSEFPFKINPPLHRTAIAYALYLLVSALLIRISIKLNSSRLRKRNLTLEKKVKIRTQEIEDKNAELKQQANLLESKNLELEAQSEELQQNASELAKALLELNETQDKLLTTARIAGRAEVATNVLHSVGNVLNSVNVGLDNLDRQVQQSRARNLEAVVQLIKDNENELSHFFQNDERGKQIPVYLDQLAVVLKKELDAYSARIREIEENVGHIKSIVATQQTHAKKIGFEQEVNIAALVESALMVTLGESFESLYKIERDYDEDLVCSTDKHLVLDVLINLIKNAKESLATLPPSNRKLDLSCKSHEADCIEISITDNGLGIEKEIQSNLFSHGFTTKPEGHGFGLHGSANAIKSLGGNLKLESEGPHKGATARITLPR